MVNLNSFSKFIDTFDVEFPCSQSTAAGKGRKEKSFSECCDRAKRYKAAAVASQFPKEQLVMASEMQGGGNRGKSYIDPSVALGILLDADLTKYQYETIKIALSSEGFDILPPYKKVLEKKCYPDELKITETCATVHLQSLLDHTSKRLFETFTAEKLTGLSGCDLTLTSKWGCDGSSGHAEYQQSLLSDASDGNIYLVSMVPLTLNSESNNEFWRNNSPSSTRYCRPISFEFAKETKDKVEEVVGKINSQIAALKPTQISIHNREINVKHNLVFTMIDGKTAQIVTHTPSAAVCYICGAKPTEMNNLELILSKTVQAEACKLGISSLHARIKFMECILHLGYNLPFQKWAATCTNKQIKQQNKIRIQERFRERLGLRVDAVQQGTGTSNNGNMSRRFFFQTLKLWPM